MESLHGGYYVVDADGRIHDHTTARTYPPLEPEQVVSGDVDGNHFLARTNPHGAITELEFVNRSDVVGHYLFELRYSNGRFSHVFTVQVAPNTVATMDRRIMARLGIRNAVGVGDRLVEFGEFTPGATHFDEDGNVTRLQDRRDASMCPGNIT